MFTEVDIYASYRLSHCCHTRVTPLFSIYLHRVTGSSDKTRCRRMFLLLPVTLSHCHASLYPYILKIYTYKW
nr:MAG TPA: hypothetical protein [Caudoviricetes sp.]